MTPSPLLLLPWLVVACAPSLGDPTKDTDEASDAPTDDDDTPTDEFEPDDFGFVYLTSEPGLGFSDAGVVLRRALPHAYDCQTEQVDGCTILTCGDERLPWAPVDAGTVNITGASQAFNLPFDEGYEGAFGEDQIYFTGGEAIVASAPGADAPAFTLGATAPTAVEVTAPAWPSGRDDLQISRDEAFNLSWQGASAGQVIAHISNSDQSVTIECPFPAADGAGAIPARVLDALPGRAGSIDVEVQSEAVVDVDTWRVRLQLSTHATAAGGLAIASVRLR